MPDAGTDKLKIDTEEQYREALSEVPRVDSAQPGAQNSSGCMRSGQRCSITSNAT